MQTRLTGLLLAVAILTLIAFLVSIRSSLASPGVYYVDATNGNDSTGDGSQSRPWRTITHALSRVSSGDTIMVRPGTYNVALGESFPLNIPPGVSLIGSGRDTTIVVGQSDKPVLYIGSETTSILSNTVVSELTLQGGSVGLDIYAGLARDATGTITVAPSITNLRILGNGTGIRMTTSGDYKKGATVAPVISGTEVISNTQAGIYIHSYGYFSPSSIAPMIQKSIVQGNGSHGISIHAEAVSANGTSAEPRIIATRIARNGGHGIFATAAYQGWARPQIEQTWITDNAGYGVYWAYGGNGANLVAGITNTVISRNQGGGIYLDYFVWAFTSGSIRVVNSTIADNANYGIYWRQSDPLHPFVSNSILWNPGADDLYSTGNPWTTAHVQYCDIEDGDFAGASGNFSKDPLFMDDEYHIGPCSPVMNAGTTVGAPSNDIDGDPRPLGTAPDVGADEFEAPCLLRVAKSASANRVQFGDVLTYNIVLTNVTPITPLSVLVTDVLPSSVELGSLWASQGTPTYASGVVTWSDTIEPGTVVTIGLQTRVMKGNTTITNSAWAQVEGILSRSPLCQVFVEPLRAFLPLVARNLCTGPIMDDFSNPASGWPVAETQYWSYGYLNGEYRMYAKQADVFGAVTRGDRQNGDLILEVDVRQSSGATGSLGIIYGLSDDWSRFYTFEIYPATQEYAVLRFSDGRWWLLNYGTSSAIRPGQSNRLRLFAGLLTVVNLYVNGVYLTSSEPYDLYAGYRVGLVAVADAAGFDARFDNYKLVPEGCPENPMRAASRSISTAPFEAPRESKWNSGGQP